MVIYSTWSNVKECRHACLYADLSGDFYEIKAIVKNVKDISMKYTFCTDIYLKKEISEQFFFQNYDTNNYFFYWINLE